MSIVMSVQKELVKFLAGFTNNEGAYLTKVPSLYLIKESTKTDPIYGVFKPCICFIIQGEKSVYLGDEQYIYGQGDYFVASVHLPIIGQVLKAKPSEPYMAVKLEFSTDQIVDVLTYREKPFKQDRKANRALFVNKADGPLLEAVLRLVKLLETPEDIPILAPIIEKEILYRILKGPNGNVLEQIAIEGSNGYHMRNAIEYISKHFNQTIRVEDMAGIANMSAPSFHRNFKESTGMSPIQYQKKLRLQEARRLLYTEMTEASDIAFRVGYESPSQFSREYSRMFGLPPREDRKQFIEQFEGRGI